jgi:thioredoxin-like negative regulator of GroEL
MDENEIAKRVAAIPGQFADRLGPRDLANVQEYARVGEWGEALDLLLACLRHDDQAITAAERDELRDLLEAMGMPTDPIAQLNVQPAAGR